MNELRTYKRMYMSFVRSCDGGSLFFRFVEYEICHDPYRRSRLDGTELEEVKRTAQL